MRCSHRATHPLRRGLWAGAPVPLGIKPRGAPLPSRAYAQTQSGCARLGPFGALFARFASALAPGPLPPRASASGRRARPPLRGPGPALAPALASLGCRARPSGLPPRLPRSARVRRFAAPWALAGPAALGLPSLRCGLPVRSALLRLGRPLALRGFPAGAPPWPARFAASGPGASAPGGLRGPSGRLFWPPAPRGFCARRACPPALSPPAGAVKIIASGPLCGPILTAPASGDV